MSLAPAPSLPPSRLTLEVAAIDVWSAELDLPSHEIRPLQESLSGDELDRAEKFRFPRDRERFIAGRGILRDILARYLGRAPEALRFSYGRFGKPALVDDGTAGLRFNLSHSGGMALCVVALRRNVGVDLERLDPSFAEDGIAEKFFSRNEVARLRSLPAAARLRGFFNCWTRKEAYVKALGDGLQISLQSFDVSLAPDEEAAFLSEREHGGWSLHALQVASEYAAAIAVEGAGPELRWWQWQTCSSLGQRT